MIGVGACSLALPLGMLAIDPIAAAPPKSSRQTPQAAEATSDSDADADANEPSDPAAEKRGMVRLNYVEASWEKVLKDVAAATDTSLVADYIPKKKFSRWDLKRHTKADALKILNQELEPQNFRLQFKGRFLVLNQMRELRHEYPAATLRGDPHDRESGKAAADDAETPPAARKKRPASTASRSQETQSRKATGRGSPIQLASGEEENSRPDSDRAAEYDQQPVPVETAVPLRTQKAGTIANRVYRAFGTQAEKTDDGPQGLRGFVVRRLPSGKRAGEGSDQLPVQFSVGVDNNRNELIVAASPGETKSIVKLIKTLDNVPKTADGAGTTRIIKTKRDAGKLATALQPELNRLAQATRKTSRRSAQTDDADADGRDSDEDMPASRAPGRNQDRPDDADETGGERSLFGSLKADVLVESVPELGILVIRGNQSDVEAVEKVIEEIERLSVQTAPRVKLAILRHISSEALASLLTSVYERLAGARNSAVQQSQAISVFPVARPNAVLIVASNADIDAVFTLIDELDQQSNPSTEFMVFQLKSAVPSQVVDKVEALYPPPTAAQAAANGQQNNVVGLVPRVRIIDDLRTNSVIVQARPRDLREIALLIEKLDVEDTNSKQQIKIFPLTNAVADEVAFTLSSSIQNVLGPSRATAAPTTGQAGGQGGAFGAQAQGAGGTAQGSAELREVKSTILEFLDKNGDEGRDLRSGILSDIRMTADLRTNSIVVTAPRRSMAFVARLIEQLDRPSATVAEIKVFKLSNADATSVQTLLERLFGIQRTGQQGGQGGGGGGQQQGVPGLLVADAEDSSSMLIPLRFSVDVRTNSIIAIGGGGALNVVEAVVLKLDESDIRQRQNEVYRLKNAPAANVATAISQFLQTQQQILTADPGIISPFEQIEREVIVVPEPTSNSLLISATPRFFKDIKELIVSIDRTPRQVLIQGLIVEVSLTNTDEFGMELGFQDSILFRRSPVPTPTTITQTTTAVTGLQTSTQQIISESATPGYLFGPAAGAAQALGNNTSSTVSNPANIAGQAVTGFGTALTNGQLGYGGLVLQAGSENVNFLLRALAVRTRVDVLSRPQIRTVDNQFSQIQVGQEIPRVNGFSSNGTAGVIVPTVQQRAIGIILQVTPRISPDGLVIMEVVARKDSLSAQQINLGVSAAGTAVTSPIVNTTNAQTVIAVNSGQTVILGGMITKNDDVEERKVPVLGDIPILGRLFRYDYKQMLRTELLIFLTPRIINDDEEAEMFKQIEAERLSFIESEAERMHGPLYGIQGSFAPGTGPGSPIAPPSPTGPGLLPNPPPKGKQIPRPPNANIPGPATSDRSPEPYPMPGADADDAGPGASLMRNDEGDLDEQFVQTKYQPAKKGTAAAGRAAAAKSTAKDADKTPVVDKTKNRFLKKKKPTKKTAEQQEAAVQAASDDP